MTFIDYLTKYRIHIGYDTKVTFYYSDSDSMDNFKLDIENNTPHRFEYQNRNLNNMCCQPLVVRALVLVES